MSSALSTAPKTPIDLDVTRLTLDVVNKRVTHQDAQHIENSITEGELSRTTDGASTLTLTVHDPRRALLKSGVFSYAIDVRLDSMFFRLVQVSKRDTDLTLTFEDREVALLRTRSSSVHASRSKVTRAEFALSLVREVKPTIPFICPQLHNRQPLAGSGDKRKAAKALPYQFRRGAVGGPPETTWEALQRLAQEVNWRCFVSAGSLYFISDEDLLRTAPRMTLSESSPEVTTIDFDIDGGKVKSEATVSARAARWAAGPGDVVQLKDLGPASAPGADLWLVHEMRRSLYDTDATILLKRPTKPLAEPLPEATGATLSGIGGTSSTKQAGFGGPAESAYEAAQAITAKRFPYVWGGGHGAAGVPSGGGFDCSGSVCAVLAAAGLGFRPGGPVSVSGALESWGVAGPGQQLTVYCNSIHTFIVFHTSKGDEHFGTGNWGKGWGGAGLNPNMHPTSGFVARHWPGT